MNIGSLRCKRALVRMPQVLLQASSIARAPSPSLRSAITSKTHPFTGKAISTGGGGGGGGRASTVVPPGVGSGGGTTVRSLDCDLRQCTHGSGPNPQAAVGTRRTRGSPQQSRVCPGARSLPPGAHRSIPGCRCIHSGLEPLASLGQLQGGGEVGGGGGGGGGREGGQVKSEQLEFFSQEKFMWS